MPLPGYRTITIDTDTFQEMQEDMRRLKMKTMPEYLRALVREKAKVFGVSNVNGGRKVLNTDALPSTATASEDVGVAQTGYTMGVIKRTVSKGREALPA